MKTHYVDELIKSPRETQFRSTFRLDGVTRGITKFGKPFLRFRLTDRTGSIPAKWWDCGDAASDKPLPSIYAVVSGRVESREDGAEVNLTAAPEWIPQPENTDEYELLAPLSLSALKIRLDDHIQSIESRPLRAMVATIFQDDSFRKSFDFAPAAEQMHHVCRHGLLQHTVEVADLAAAIADVQKTWGYRSINRDLAVAGALLHDIGKVDELGRGADGAYRVTPRGYFIGHIVSGVQRVNRAINQTPDFPPGLKDIVLHLVLAHHGKREWGSPVTPALAEAQIVHLADQVDVQLFYLQEASAASSEDFTKAWKLGNQRLYTRSVDELLSDGGDSGGRVHEVEESPFVSGENEILRRLNESRLQNGVSALPVFRTCKDTDAPGHRFRTRRLPLVGRAAAGPPVLAEEYIEDYVDVDSDGLPADSQLYLLRVAGESMNGDGIHDGDLVVVRKQRLHRPADIVVVYLPDREEAAIKRLIRQPDGQVRLDSSNPAVLPIVIGDARNAQVHGRVVGIVRGNEHST